MVLLVLLPSLVYPFLSFASLIHHSSANIFPVHFVFNICETKRILIFFNYLAIANTLLWLTTWIRPSIRSAPSSSYFILLFLPSQSLFAYRSTTSSQLKLIHFSPFLTAYRQSSSLRFTLLHSIPFLPNCSFLAFEILISSSTSVLLVFISLPF